MNKFTIIIALASIPATIGIVIDRLLLNRTKGTLHQNLLKYWIRLDESNIPDLVTIMARVGISAIQFVFRPNSSLLFKTVISFTLSGMITLLAILIGEILSSSYQPFSNLTYQPFIVFQLIAINFPFDLLTVVITYHLLIKISEERAVNQAYLIFLDIIAASVCAILCGIFALLWFDSKYTFFEMLRRLFSYILILLEPAGTTGSDSAIIGAYVSTTLIPTMSYMILLFFLILTKPIIIFGKKYAAYFIERVTEVKDHRELIVFTLLGCHFSAIVVIVSALNKIFGS